MKEIFSIRTFKTGTHSARLGKKSIALLGAVVLATSGTVVSAKEKASELMEPSTMDTETTKQVTEADVDTAKKVADKASEQVKVQEEVVRQAQVAEKETANQLKQAEQEYDTAKQLADEATPDGIATAKEEIVSAEEGLTSAEEHLQSEKDSLAQVNEAVETNQAIVKASKNLVAENEADVSEAQNNVAKVQSILDGTGQAQIVKEAEDAAAKLETTKQELKIAEINLHSAQAADANRKQGIIEAEKQVAATHQEFTDKVQVANQAIAKANETAEVLKITQATFIKAENDVKGMNTITLSADYITALRDYAQNYTEKGAEAKAKLDAMVADLRSKHDFKVNENDDKTILDTNNLSEATLTELSNFASDLINQIRQAFGTTSTVVTAGAMKLADLTTDGYITDNWSLNDVLATGHDAKAVNKAANTLGLPVSSSQEEATGQQYYENMNSWGISSATTTLSAAKQKIYESIISFMFNGYEYLHAESIAGLSTNSKYIGVDLSSRAGVNAVHILMVNDEQIKGTLFDTKGIDNPKTGDKIQAFYAVAQTNLANAISDNAEAQSQKDLALSDKAHAQTNLDTANTTLIRIKETPELTPAAQEKLAIATSNVQVAELANVQAQVALANLNADVKQKQANLNRAKQVLAEKEEDLSAAQARLKQDQDILAGLKMDQEKAQLKVSEAEKQVQTAKNKLIVAKKYLADLENSPAKLAAAKVNFLTATTQLENAKEKLATEVARLSQLKQIQRDTSKQYERTLAAYREVLEAAHQAKLAKEYENIIQAGRKPVAIVDEAGNVTGYMAQESNSSSVISLPTKALTTQKTSVLPSTGEENTLMSIAGITIGLLSLLGLGLRKKQY